MEADRPDSLVSVLICTRDRPALLRRAVESALTQTYENLEVVVVDDGSDPALEYTFDDPRVRVVYLRPHVGIGAARNVALDNARGEFLALLDDDDYYFPDKIERQLAFLLDHPDVDLVYSRVRVVDTVSGGEWEYLPDGYVHDAYGNFRYFNVIHTNSTLFRRRVMEMARFDDRLTKYDDTQFHLLVTQRCNVAYLPITVAAWRRNWSPTQVSAPDRRRSYENFRIVCEDFREMIRSHPGLRWRYYGRLAWQALRCGSFLGVMRALWWMVT